MKNSVSSMDNTLVTTETTDWVVGEVIIISSSSYDISQSEKV